MIRHEVLVSQLRFYEETSEDPYAQYDAVCTVIWNGTSDITIKGLHGTLSRKIFRELLDWLAVNNITTVRANRAPQRLLPCAQEQLDGSYLVLVSDLLKHFRYKGKAL